MITAAKHNGIDFSTNKDRANNLTDLNLQRLRSVIPIGVEIAHLVFESDSIVDNPSFAVFGDATIIATQAEKITLTGSFVYIYKFTVTVGTPGDDVYFSFTDGESRVYSELCTLRSSEWMAENGYNLVTGANADNRHGFITKEAFGYFKFSELATDIFLNEKKEYDYSYSRKKILSSENQIGKRLTFENLNMYNQILLKWLCNCEILTINGYSYQLISDITDLMADENSEIKDLRADFVEVTQSFFNRASNQSPLNTFTKNFFN
jgi:hypothetical protein